MRLTVPEREVGTPGQKVSTSRDINIGLVTPQAQSNLATQLEHIGSEVSRKIKAANQTMEYSKVIADAKNKMATYYSSRSKDVDNYDTLTDDVDEYFKGLSSEVTTSITDVTQRARIHQGLSQIGIGFHSQAINDATDQAIVGVKADHVVTRASMTQEASIGSDDAMSSVFINYGLQVRNLAKLGIMEADDAEKDILSFANDAVRAKVRNLINTNPETAQEYLLDTSTFSKLLEPEHRENLLAQTQRLIDAKDRKAEADYKANRALEEANLTKWRDANYINSLQKIREGTETVENLDQLANAGLLHKGDYQPLQTALMNRGKDITGNKKIFDSFKDRAAMGELELRDVMAARNDEQLSWEQFNDLTSDIQAGAVIVQTEEYKTYLTSLKTKLGWTTVGIMSSDQSVLIGNATIEFRKRAIDGEPIETIFDDLSVRYSKSMREVVEKPRYRTNEEAKRNIKAGPLLDRELYLQSIFEQRAEEERAYQQKSKQVTEE
jgi:hypothetical protein